MFESFLNEFDISSEETLVRLMIYEIRERNPDAIHFRVDGQAVKSILLHLKMRKYATLMYLYGHAFLLEVLKMYEEAENYEECQEIVNQLNEHNKTFKENLKTK